MLKRRIELFLIIIVFVSFTYSAYGQTNDKTNNGKCEVGAGAGVLSSEEMFDGNAPGLLSPGLKAYIIAHYSGTYFIKANYRVSKRISLGISFAYENESGAWQKQQLMGRSTVETTPLGTFRRQAFTYAPEVSVKYLIKGLFSLYGTMGVGVTYRNEVDDYSDSYYQGSYNNGKNELGASQEVNNNKVRPNVYFSPFGLSAGNRVMWFMEIGIGYKGIFNTGISVKL